MQDYVQLAKDFGFTDAALLPGLSLLLRRKSLRQL